MKEFINVLEDLLDENDITLKELSRKINVHCSILYAYRNDNILPSVKTAVKIANYFNCSINYLMGLDSGKKDSDFGLSYDIDKFYNRYIELLHLHGITHNFLSNKIGVNNSSLLNWKKGKTPKMYQLILLAKYFDVSIDYLVGRSDKNFG